VAAPQYFLLLGDGSRDDLEAVDDYELGSFEPDLLWKGKRFEDKFPSDVRLLLTDGAPCDLLECPLGWLIFSPNLAATLKPLTGDSVQYIPLSAKKGKERVPYIVVNPLGLIDAVVGGRSKSKLTINQLTLDSKKIPPDRHLFRLKSHPLFVVISPEVLKMLKGKGFQGLSAFKVKMA